MTTPHAPRLTGFDVLRIVEVRTKIVSVSGFLIGTLYVLGDTGRIDPTRTALMAVAVLAVDMATTGFNTFFDWYSGVDRRAHNRESDKVLIHRNVPPGYALLISVALYLVAAIAGLVLASKTSWWLVPAGAGSMLVGLAYNAGPLPISRTPVGELFAGGFLGWVLVTLTIYVERLTLAGDDLLVGIPSALMVASILTVNNTCDIDGDRRSGRHTLSILIGRRGGEVLVYVLGAAAFAGAATLAVAGVVPRAVLIGSVAAAVLSVPSYRTLNARGFSHETKGPSMGAISRVFLWFTLGVTVPLVIAALLRVITG